ncbi:MAG: LysM peptidoglycan-binding domain-containing protein [Bdellovibrionota bacterium]
MNRIDSRAYSARRKLASCVLAMLLLSSGPAQGVTYFRVVQYPFKRGDTVSDILHKHGVSGIKMLYGKYGMVPLTLRLNRLTEDTARKIPIGQVVKVPIPVEAEKMPVEVQKKIEENKQVLQAKQPQPLGLVEVKENQKLEALPDKPEPVVAKAPEVKKPPKLEPMFQTGQIKVAQPKPAPAPKPVKAPKPPKPKKEPRPKKVVKDRYTPYRKHGQSFWVTFSPYYHRIDGTDKGTAAKASILSDLSFAGAVDWNYKLRQKWSIRAHLGLEDLIYDERLPSPINNTSHNIIYRIAPGLRFFAHERFYAEALTGLETQVYYFSPNASEIRFDTELAVPLVLQGDWIFFRRKNNELGLMAGGKYVQGWGTFSSSYGYLGSLYYHYHPVRVGIKWEQNWLETGDLDYQNRAFYFVGSVFF